MSPKQPVPSVTRADVERVVARDFADAERARVLEILAEYGTEKWEGGVNRVHLAVLKLADGDVERLRDAVKAAKRDWRDVLAWAEYPGAMRAPWGTRAAPLAPDAQQRIYDEDWRQYQAWLARR